MNDKPPTSQTSKLGLSPETPSAPPSKDVGPWPELDVFQQEAMRNKARPRIASQVEAYGHMSDEWVANRVRMLYRDDLEHEPICSAARDRIMRLSIQLAEARGVIEALKARNGEPRLALKASERDLDTTHERAGVHKNGDPLI